MWDAPGQEVFDLALGAIRNTSSNDEELSV